MARAPYTSRRVLVCTDIGRDEVSWTVRDQGKGFDPRAVPDPTDPKNLDRSHGRGLLLIRTFMDSVSHNEAGNEITMIKRRKPGRKREEG
jgi:anti-sigma regulatory factor (Ser/Thr protein kinase)